jgi:hypothetical protein
MFDPRSSKIAEQLRDMLVNQDFTSPEFYDQSTGDEQICTEVAQQSSVCIENIQRVLLGNFDSDLPKTMGEGIFIYLLKMSAAKKLVNLEAGFAD